MNTAVFLHLCILISFMFVVKCDDDDNDVESSMKCRVCKATILEMDKEIKKIDPRKKVEVSGFRLDANGKSKSKSVQYSKSETFLTELMESMCEDNNFSSVRQSIIKDIVVKQMLDNNGALDFTPDGDMSQTLNHLCLEVLEENENEILKLFMNEVTPTNIENIICTKVAKYCDKDEDNGEKGDERSEL